MEFDAHFHFGMSVRLFNLVRRTTMQDFSILILATLMTSTVGTQMSFKFNIAGIRPNKLLIQTEQA
jgi:hypothetical protein